MDQYTTPEALAKDCKDTADRLRQLADEVQAGKVHGFVLGVWYGHGVNGQYAHTVTALWENPDPKIPPAITTLVGVAALVQDRAMREFHATGEGPPAVHPSRIMRPRKLDG